MPTFAPDNPEESAVAPSPASPETTQQSSQDANAVVAQPPEDPAEGNERDAEPTNLPVPRLGDFRVVEGSFSVSRLPRDEKYADRISISPLLGKDPTDEQILFKSSIETTESIIRGLFPASLKGEDQKARLSSYIERLVLIGKLGLEDDTSIKSAQSSLENFRRDVVYAEGPAVKNGYMIELGKYAIAFSLVSIIVFWAIRKSGYFEGYPFLSKNVNICLVWAGAMVGAWLSFGIRNVQPLFESLGRLEADLMKPPVRLVFAGFLAVVLALVFVLQVVQFKIGLLDTSKIMQSNLIAILVGLFCGIAEQVLPTTVGRRASEFLGEVDSRAGAGGRPSGNG